MLVCGSCGGQLVIDPLTARFTFPRDNGPGVDIYQGVKCIACGERQGVLANVSEREPIDSKIDFNGRSRFYA